MIDLLMLVLSLFVIIGPGRLTGADLGILEAVAERRMACQDVENCLPEETDLDRYGALIALADCKQIGQEGVLVADGSLYLALVVDCANGHQGHDQRMKELGLLGDVNRPHLWSRDAILFLMKGD